MNRDQVEGVLASADGLRDAGDAQGALKVYLEAVEFAPDFAKGHFKLATAYDRLGRKDEAEKCYREALRLDPEYAEAFGNLGVLLFARGDWDEAELCYRNALANNPDYFEAHVNLSRLLFIASRYLESLYFARRASGLRPQAAIAVERAALALGKLGRIGESLAELRRATEVDPTLASAWLSLGSALQALGHGAESDAAFLKAIEASNDDPGPRINWAFWANYQPLPRETVWQRHREFGSWVRARLGPVAVDPPDALRRPDPDRRLRVGLVSPDLRRHSVAYFVKGAFEHLDHKAFQLFAYFDHHKEDEVSAALKPMFHHWCDIFATTDEALFDRIRGDRIDVLIDLAGLSGGNRLRVFGRRAAPLQLTYLGYPNTTGLDCMDYRITDHWADPAGDGDEFHSETLWRLPACFLCYSAPLDARDVAEPPMLKNGYVSFGSFNNRIKISDQCLKLWVALLRDIPSARLVLKSIQGTGDEASRQGLLDRFVSSGIDPARVQVHAQVSGLENHLDMYSMIDIALDTFPYNGTTTTCEALWMGVPVIGLKGDRHAARVGESLLNNLGLPELVAADEEDYLRVARSLAADPQRLAELRGGMRDRMRASPLMDSRALGRDMSAALRDMWACHCQRFAGDLPVEIEPPATEHELLRLHIGGRERKDGWQILDAESRQEVDFVGDIRDLSAFRDESCAEVYASHVLEHVPPQDILPVLNGIHRILVPGGSLYLSVPDLDTLVWLFSSPILNKAEKFHVMRMMFGGQVDEHDLHRIGLNFDFLADYLSDVGFSSLEHVESFGLFDDTSEMVVAGHRISLNLIVIK